MEADKLAVIRIRGPVKVNKDIEGTMRLMKLYKKNTCVIVKNNKTTIGMLHKIKDYVTWGEVSKDTFRMLLEKRCKIMGNKNLSEEYLKDKTKLGYEQFVNEFFSSKLDLKQVPGVKLFFRLRPPIKGFERKGIKKPFSMGGVLGYRKDKINELLMRMI